MFKAPPFTSKIYLPAFVPGLALAAGIAAAAKAVPEALAMPALSPMIVALVLGVALRASLGPQLVLKAGFALSQKQLMRLGIVGLGLQISLPQILDLGIGALVAVALTLLTTLVFTRKLGAIMAVPAPLTALIAAGTSICGASAIMAARGPARASDEDVAYAIACITLFGTVLMVFGPILTRSLGIDQTTSGLWLGASLHEVGQVVGATHDNGAEAGLVAKLTRVLMLIPVLSLLAYRPGEARQGGLPLPWFAFGFLLLAAINPYLGLSDTLRGQISAGSTFLLIMALGAMGYGADLTKLREKGRRPLLLAAAATVYVALAAAGLLWLLS